MHSLGQGHQGRQPVVGHRDILMGRTDGPNLSQVGTGWSREELEGESGESPGGRAHRREGCSAPICRQHRSRELPVSSEAGKPAPVA